MNCEHNKRKSRCKECGGSQICEHDKNKYDCKKCDGKGICEHSKNKRYCKECKGSQICEHDKIKRQCRECNGSAFCEHNIIKSSCKECKGSNICEHNINKTSCILCSKKCEHNKIKNACKECGGSSYCEHNKIKSCCKHCNGSQVCQHDKIKSQCKDCNGSQICKHKKRKYTCKECKGNGICEHNKIKKQCIICSPDSNKFCKKCRLFNVTKNNNYLCNYCNPDKSTRQKTKELQLKKFLIDNEYKFEYNIYCNYDDKRYFPDFKIDCNTFFLIIECDEYAHRTYDKNDEKIREDNIRLALNKNCVFIRYNPDNKRNRKKIKTKDKEKILKSYIDYYKSKERCDNEICYLFY